MTKISELPSTPQYTRDYIKTFSKRMLKTQLFVGTFQEKRYVEPLNSYRDVVRVHSDEEQFIENVLAVIKKLQRDLQSDMPWIGITGPDTVGAPVGYNLWVVLPIEVFGTYWFKVKTVEFLEKEVRVKLDVVRPLKNEKSTSDISESDENQSFDFKSTVENLSNSIASNMLLFYKEYVTLANIKDSVIFIVLLIVTIATGGANIIKYLMEYSLKLMKETSGFIKVCTPIIISLIELVRKSIYGLFSLIAVLVHGKPTLSPPQPYNNMYMSNPYDMLEYHYQPRRALPYRSSVKIEPLD